MATQTLRLRRDLRSDAAVLGFAGLMWRKGWLVLVALVSGGSFAPAVLAARSGAGKDSLATAITQRLNQAGDMTFPMPRSAGYFDGNPIDQKTPIRSTRV